jgi:ATP-dependent DNA helicase RecQ
LQFITGKNELYEFERTHPQLEPLIKSLLRAYEGIFDHSTFISELLLTRLLKKSFEEIKLQLAQLHQYGIVEYLPQKDKPQILLLRNRVKAEDLTIQIPAYNLRKEKFQLRVKEMIHYVKEDGDCRSRMIGYYFGDVAIKACGVCDNCLRKKAISISKEEFDLLHHRILNLVKYESLPGRDLLSKLGDVKKEKAWKVIEFLQAENKIEMDQQGRVKLK